jgi:hypothetical protein
VGDTNQTAPGLGGRESDKAQYPSERPGKKALDAALRMKTRELNALSSLPQPLDHTSMLAKTHLLLAILRTTGLITDYDCAIILLINDLKLRDKKNDLI